MTGMLATIKTWLAKRMLIIEFCHRCGARQPLVWHSGDVLWSEVTGEKEGGGVLCPKCFDKLAEAKRISIVWKAEMNYRF